MKETRIRSKIAIFISVILAVLLTLTFVLSSFARDKNAKCHKCKEKDLKLVQRHKMLGYDGCLKCHDDIVEKPKKKHKKSK
ncbi:hypothetical protein ACFL2A_00065 [Thermodesulfobacteriota bacterium]